MLIVFFSVINLTPLWSPPDKTLTLLKLSENSFLSIFNIELSPNGITCSWSGNFPSINLLTNFVPPTSTDIDDGPSLIIIFSEASDTNFPISLIDFFGTMPLIVFGTASRLQYYLNSIKMAWVAELPLPLGRRLGGRVFATAAARARSSCSARNRWTLGSASRQRRPSSSSQAGSRRVASATSKSTESGTV